MEGLLEPGKTLHVFIRWRMYPRTILPDEDQCSFISIPHSPKLTVEAAETEHSGVVGIENMPFRGVNGDSRFIDLVVGCGGVGERSRLDEWLHVEFKVVCTSMFSIEQGSHCVPPQSVNPDWHTGRSVYQCPQVLDLGGDETTI